MKVKKIDLKVEYLDLPNGYPYLRVAKTPEHYPTMILNEDELPNPASMVNFETLEYPILKMYHPEKGESYVAIQDRDIFEELMEFGKGREHSLREEGRKKGRQEGLMDGYKARMKDEAIYLNTLPWWKRKLLKMLGVK